MMEESSKKAEPCNLVFCEDVFSICIFVYKNLDSLEKTVKSVFEQSYPWIELIISDDHSEESTERQFQSIKDILEPYKGKFLNTTINVNSVNLGTVKHINKILPIVKGKYLCMLGSGDRLYQTDILQTVADFFHANDFLLCFSKNILSLNKKHNIILPEQKAIRCLQRHDRSLLNLCCREINHITTIGCFFRTEIFDIYGFYDENYVLMEDAPFFLRLMFQDVPFGYIDKITCIHEKGGVSNRKKKSDILEKDSLRTLTDIKYVNRNRLNNYSKRVVLFKYKFRTTDKLLKKVVACIIYPDAAAYILWLCIKDWFYRIRFLPF